MDKQLAGPHIRAGIKYQGNSLRHCLPEKSKRLLGMTQKSSGLGLGTDQGYGMTCVLAGIDE
jgi:hypothetical protein